MTAAGGAIVLLTDSAKKTNAALGVTALQLGVTKEEMRDLALETTNVTFPLEEVQKSFDLLARAGVTNKDAIAETATAFDTLGDAIGIPASQVTEQLIPAFNAFGIPLEEAGQHTDTLTHLFRNTTVEMSDFSSTVNRLSPDLDMLGIGLDDAAAILEVLAAKGVQGSAATREFRTAISQVEMAEKELAASNVKVAETEAKLREEREKLNEITEDYRYELSQAGDDLDKQESISRKYEKALKDQKEKIADTEATLADYRASVGSASSGLEAFYKELGITSEEVETYKAKINEANGITQDFADAANEQYGMVDNLKQMWSEWSLRIGSALEPLDSVGAVMTTLGPIMMGIGPAMKAFSAIQTGTLIPSLTATAAAGWAAVAPWLPLVAAIAAVIAIAWLLYENWDEVATAICEIGGKIWEFFGGLWEGLLELFGGGFEGILGILFPPFGIYEMVKDNWGPITEFLGKLWDGALDIFGKAWDGIVAALFPAKGLGDMVEENWGGIQEFVGKLWGKIVEFFGKGFENAIRVMFPAIGLVELVFKNWGPITQAVENIWDSVVWIFKSFYNTAASYGRDIVFGLWDGIFSLYSWIHDQVTGFGESILGWVTDGLGALWPHSPSEAGVKIGAGLTAGIEKGLGDTLTTVRRAIDGLEDEMVVDVNPTVGMPIGGSQGGIRVEAGAGVQEVHYHFDGTFHIREEADIHKLAYELERMRSTKARMRGIGTW